MNIIIDVDKLRKDLMDYYGTAMSSNPMAIMDLVKIENASDEEIVMIARKNNINLYDYEIKHNSQNHHR